MCLKIAVFVFFFSFFNIPAESATKKFIFHQYGQSGRSVRVDAGAKRHKTSNDLKAANPDPVEDPAVAAGAGAGAGADANAQGKASSLGKSIAESLIGSLSGSESQSYSKIKVKTRLSTASNAKSNATAASKVKTYAHANTQTKVKTNQGVGTNDNKPPSSETATTTQTTQPPEDVTVTPPIVTRPPKAFWTPSYEVVTEAPTETPSDFPVGPPFHFSEKPEKTTVAPPTPAPPTVICVQCPYQCPVQSVCPCACPVVQASPTQYCYAPCSEPTQITYLSPVQECVPGQYASAACKRERESRMNSSNQDAPENNSSTINEQIKIFTDNPYKFGNAAVAADHYKCSEMGKNILKKGGSAVDAIITVHMCVEIVNSHSTGLGGGGFIVCHQKHIGKGFTIDFRESLPKSFNPNKTTYTQGDLILIPGVLKGLHKAHQIAGKLPWKQLFTEPIKLASEGFRIHEALDKAIDKKADYIMTNLGLREIFAPEGHLLSLGNLLKRPKLADTYKKIAASGGSDIFYKGSIAKQVVEDVQNAGGSMTLEDLGSYEAIVRDPIKAKIAGRELLTVGPPASGVTVALMLKIMEYFHWNISDLRSDPGKVYHQMVEAMKFAYAPSSYLSDPRFVDDVDELVQFMLDPVTANEMRNYIDNTSHILSYYGPFTSKAQNPTGTSHMSVVASNGDSCSLTTSINAYFGSKIVSRELGFLYNNEVSDFNEFWPTFYNLTKDEKIPGKRPMSKVAPMIFLDHKGNTDIVIGAAGGFFIPTALGSTLAHYLFFKDNITMAVARPRIHCQLFPPTVVYEESFPEDIVPLLVKYNHQLVINDTFSVSGQEHAIMGVIQAIVKNPDGRYEAVCDYRKGGLPAGY